MVKFEEKSIKLVKVEWNGVCIVGGQGEFQGSSPFLTRVAKLRKDEVLEHLVGTLRVRILRLWGKEKTWGKLGMTFPAPKWGLSYLPKRW